MTDIGRSGEAAFQSGFFPPLQVIADVLEIAGVDYRYPVPSDRFHLHGVRIFQTDHPVDPAYLYLCREEDLIRASGSESGMDGLSGSWACPFRERKVTTPLTGVSFLVQCPDLEAFSGSAASVPSISSAAGQDHGIPGRIYFSARHSIPDILTLVQDAFDRFHRWNLGIQEALLLQTPLQEIFDLSQDIFRNPIFLHDRDFIILAECNHKEQMIKRGRDRRTGRPMVQMDLINDFRTDPVYIEGLKARRPVMYPSEQTGYQILYRNIWQGDIYRGRILDLEVDNRILPGDFAIIDYLGKLLEHFLYAGDLRKFSISDDENDLLEALCDKKTTEEQKIQNYLQFQKWKRNDRYVVMRIVTQQREFNIISSYALLNQLNTILAAGRAFFHKEGITLVVNLSYAHEKTADVVSRLAVPMRDSLLKIGVSSENRDFMQIGILFDQANIALTFGLSSDSMIWYYYFDQYMLDYMVQCSTENMPVELLCTDSLQKLLEYDQKNNTDLCRTLKAYLIHDRNVLQTSKVLFIHRSTLTYRLEKIQKLIGVNLDDPTERLKLMMSYYMMSRSSNRV
ncbi:MAG: PucR family transcriptional regulator [Bilifractor sp.]